MTDLDARAREELSRDLGRIADRIEQGLDRDAGARWREVALDVADTKLRGIESRLALTPVLDPDSFADFRVAVLDLRAELVAATRALAETGP